MKENLVVGIENGKQKWGGSRLAARTRLVSCGVIVAFISLIIHINQVDDIHSFMFSPSSRFVYV